AGVADRQTLLVVITREIFFILIGGGQRQGANFRCAAGEGESEINAGAAIQGAQPTHAITLDSIIAASGGAGGQRQLQNSVIGGARVGKVDDLLCDTGATLAVVVQVTSDLSGGDTQIRFV